MKRVAGGILQMGTTKLYSPEFRNHMTPGFFTIRYPKRGEDHDKIQQSYQKTRKATWSRYR
mgnify:CR=1 FL=1